MGTNVESDYCLPKTKTCQEHTTQKSEREMHPSWIGSLSLSLSSARALCWFLHWGSVSGNTINALLKGRLSGAPKAGSNLIFETLFVSYYAICFFLVHLTSTFLRILPRCPPFVNAILGAVLTVVAGSFVVPIGMLGLITAPLRKTTVPLL